MAVIELYRHFLTELEKIYERPEAENITSMVFEHIAVITKADLVKDPDRPIDQSSFNKLNEALRELKTNKPVQYVLSESWFYKMKLKVSPAVLIPRPETEELTTSVIQYLKDKPDASILDIGTGSGCIAIAIKKNSPRSIVTAIDISADALRIAKENALTQETNVDLFKIDFLDEQEWGSLPVFDVIVSNPPYIPLAEKELLDKNVSSFEPHLALFVENKIPLIFYEKTAAFGKQHLKPGGKIFMETHEAFAVQVASLFNNDHYSSIIVKDMYEKERMVIATRHSQ